MWPKQTKMFSEISEIDYKRHPVWTWWDDDYDLLEPAQFSPFLSAHCTTLFVYTELKLKDQSAVNAVVVFRQSNRWIYLIKFFPWEGKRFDYSRMFANKRQLKLLENILNKKFEEISPAKYNTPYKFIDGTALKGTIHI